MKPEMKKLIIANLPYLLFVYLFGKLGQAYRLADGHRPFPKAPALCGWLRGGL